MAEGLGNTAIADGSSSPTGPCTSTSAASSPSSTWRPDDEADRRVAAVLRYLHEPSTR